MNDLIVTLGRELVWVVIGACILVGMITRAVTTIVTNVSRERTRREIAAYIAEGSIGPEQGERLLRAEGRLRPIPNA